MLVSRYCDEEDQYERGNRLEYTRIDGKFCLVVSEYETHISGDTTISNRMAWSGCPRDVKLQTIDHIPALLDNIAKRIESTIEDAEEKSETIRRQLKEFGVVLRETK